jgi:hypothetical protein
LVFPIIGSYKIDEDVSVQRTIEDFEFISMLFEIEIKKYPNVWIVIQMKLSVLKNMLTVIARY